MFEWKPVLTNNLTTINPPVAFSTDQDQMFVRIGNCRRQNESNRRRS